MGWHKATHGFKPQVVRVNLLKWGVLVCEWWYSEMIMLWDLFNIMAAQRMTCICYGSNSLWPFARVLWRMAMWNLLVREWSTCKHVIVSVNHYHILPDCSLLFIVPHCFLSLLIAIVSCLNVLDMGHNSYNLVSLYINQCAARY